MRIISSRLTHLAVMLLTTACSGGPSDLDGRDSPAPSPATSATTCLPTAASVRESIFKVSCDGSGCHGSANPAAGLNLIDGSLAQLANKSSALCDGWSLIVPGSLEKSFLYQKVTASAPACGDTMPPGTHLSEASARCLAEWIEGLAASGCQTCGGAECVALASDSAHCGACNNSCPEGVACADGVCSCPAGAKACAGRCVDMSQDVLNCGSCGNACAAGSSCEGGSCSCASGLQACGEACADLESDAQNCGACGNACEPGQVCLTGKCSTGCGTLTQCGASCVDTRTNVLNCGGCDAPCPAGLACAGGKCGCSSGVLCGSSCADLDTDTSNCGQCGVACGPGEACVDGACECAASAPVSFKNDVAPILAGACTGAGCHAGVKPKEGLALEATKAYAELVNVTASQCGGQRKLVAPGSPRSSYLLQKLLDVDVCTGTQMPKAGQSLPRNELVTISGWICSGAPDN